MLVRRDGHWLKARAGSGFVPILPEKSAALDAALRDPVFLGEPPYVEPGCTDAGASLLWTKLAGGTILIRRGACGATERTERTIFLAIGA